ncbi:amino acid ABC transporter permease [Lactobacillus kunkeei]|uniref:amino acid ABC transporter permease n=1 Tax=Apilactobacillus nanyangensis TaxID=2799579 RepID=UPI0016504524|nr:amino acid ABC transporter permease [Apilactobacillus nanyangensis]MBC6388607.1 amino acid ABC transporter permease [Apilactobacillus kunkeei]MCT6859067.1 amino acid ABC transporter permease [Apilactobacillus sp.]
MSFISSFSFMSQYWMMFVQGVITTIELAIISIVFGFIIGIVLAILKKSKYSILSIFAKAYIGFIRDTPLLIQIYIVYIGLPMIFDVNISDFATGVIALTLYSAAYIAEIIRSGIESLPIGQFEASLALGMNKWKMMRDIILPQAIKNILPALGNQFIGNVKDSSLVSVLGITDLMYQAQTVRGSTALGVQPILVAAAIYLVITWILNCGMSYAERRMSVNDIR